MPATVTVIVLSYNGAADTLACLESLLADDDGSFDILVIDNASTDGAPGLIRAQYPRIELLELTENRGWAGGNNVGVAVALERGAQLVCLLNNDTIVPRGAIRRLAHTSRRFGPCLLHPAIDYADASEGAQLDPGRQADGPGAQHVAQDPMVFELDYAYGACLMIPASLFGQMGNFDERFFLQMEETDFWLRARARGVRSLCDTAARIVHGESRSFGSRMTPIKTYYIVRNTLLLMEKHRRNGRGLLAALRSIYWLLAKLSGRAGNSAWWGATLVWSLSRDPHSRAARAGLRDYAFRHFGRMGPSVARSLGGRTAHATPGAPSVKP